MKAMVLLATFLGFAVLVPQQQNPDDFGLPELHKINSVSLGPSYSCRSREEAARGYENTVLFLSAYSRRRNSPDLQFNGACGSPDNFQSWTAGDDMALIADLGEMPLEKLTAHIIFDAQPVNPFDRYPKFAYSVPVQPKHTYAVLVNKSIVRGLFVFTVTGYVPNKRVDLRYAVKEYQVVDVKAQSPGFKWDANND